MEVGPAAYLKRDRSLSINYSQPTCYAGEIRMSELGTYAATGFHPTLSKGKASGRIVLYLGAVPGLCAEGFL